jgi:hypothetical protein
MKKTEPANIESKVAETVLQKPVEITIGDKTYTVAPPSIATLILVSEAVSKLPQQKLDTANAVSESLYIARHCSVVGEIAAILILGAKGLAGERKKYFGLKKEIVDLKSELAGKILEELGPEQLNDVLGNILSKMGTAFFLGTIDFLIKVNLLKAETKAETTTTVSGQSSPES